MRNSTTTITSMGQTMNHVDIEHWMAY
jgi:hypothetical protein